MTIDKQYILDEIKRTAEANNGIPLGTGKFFKETGIKKADWEGKFWVRWSEAQQEAGYIPNQMQMAYTDEFLIEAVIGLIRELGKFPVNNEMRMKARNDKDFPAHNTFDRFGTKKQLISRIVKYSLEHDGYGDVAEICARLDSSNKQLTEDTENLPETDLWGSIYLLKSGRYYKIGRTNAVGRRERELAIQLPDKAELVHEIKTDDPVGIEAYWHKRFKDKRKNGEWFELDSTDISAFKRRKFM